MTKRVSRNEDMSVGGKLVLIQQNDGDVIVCIQPDSEDRDYEGSPFGVSVEFCSTGIGGGRSPRTLKALKQLIKAIDLDNIADEIQGRIFP